MLQTQICLNTAPRRHCHFEKENLFETRWRRQGGSLCQKWFLNNGKGPRLAECHILYRRYNWLWVFWCVMRKKKVVSVMKEWETRAANELLNWAALIESLRFNIYFIWVWDFQGFSFIKSVDTTERNVPVQPASPLVWPNIRYLWAVKRCYDTLRWP